MASSSLKTVCFVVAGTCLGAAAATGALSLLIQLGWGVSAPATIGYMTPPAVPTDVGAQTADAGRAKIEGAALAWTATPGATAPAPTFMLSNTPTPTLTPTDTPTPTLTVSPTSAGLTGMPFALETPVDTLVPPTLTPTPLAPPPMVSRAEWGAEPPSGAYRTHTPDRITLHHDGVFFKGNAVERIRSIQRYALHSHGWVDIPYHYLIDLQGNIYEGRPATAVGDTATDYDPTGHILITLLGNYDEQPVDPRQLEAIVTVATWLSASYAISPQHIAGHRDYALTSCPGDNLYAYLANGFIAREVEARLLSLP